MKPIPENILAKMNPKDRPKGTAGMTRDDCRNSEIVKTEKELQAQLSALLRRNDLDFINPDMRKKSALPVGWPDYTIFLPNGKTIFWEAKVWTPLRPDQLRVRARLEAKGHQYRVIRDLLQAQEHLKQVEAQQSPALDNIGEPRQ